MTEKLAVVDRDGTIIVEPERPKDVDPRETFPLKSEEQVVFMDGAIEGLKTLRKKGYLLALATNQTFLGTPKHPQDIFDRVMNKMNSELAKEAASFDFIMVCPHGPDDNCTCRKPNTGGMTRFLSEHPDIDLSASYMFGDRPTDGEFAKNLGVNFVPIETNGKFQLPKEIEGEVVNDKKEKK